MRARTEARRDLFFYIEGFYNSRRLHSALVYVRPAQTERIAAYPSIFSGEDHRLTKTQRPSEFAEVRIVSVIVEIAASGLTKIPVSDQVSFLSNRFTAPVKAAEVYCSKKSRRARAE